MKTVVELLTDELKKAFAECGYDEQYAKVTVSNRPDLCEYQCNGAMAAAKAYKKAPFMIADDVAAKLAGSEVFEKVESVKPGFINLSLGGEFLKNYLADMAKDDKYGYSNAGKEKTVIVDYGGANAAKPLHDRKPELVYFDENYKGEYPKEAPFTISELEEIYPAASAKSKEDPAFMERAHLATAKLQNGDPACTAIWNHIMAVSKADLKKNYDNLDVTFDLWKGESDAQPYIPDMIQKMIDDGIAHESQGAIVVDIQEETDTKELPPCIVRKSDGAALYATSDLATLVEREKLYSPDAYIYLADKRQELHFTQVFRTAKKAGIVPQDADMTFLGFGTMNGKDGKPFKTRSGGVMRLQYLIEDIDKAVYEKSSENRSMSEEEAKNTAKIVGLAALKYGDLSNQASKDYVFDIDRFTSFEGNTGPYILYTVVRIKSIFNKYAENGGRPEECSIDTAKNASEKKLMLSLVKFNEVFESAYKDNAPHKLCQFIYEVADAFGGFYHDTMILAETDEKKKQGYIALLGLTRNVLECCLDLLGIRTPERM